MGAQFSRGPETRGGAAEKHSLEFLYGDADQCYFMHPETFEQTEIAASMVGPQAGLLEPGMRVTIEFAEAGPVNVDFPEVLEVKIADTAPPVHQQADTNFKPAKVAHGVEVLVPQFVKTGDIIRLDTRTLRYMDRAKARHF